MPRYEYVEGNSSKFWEIELDGVSFTTTYGRLGTSGQMSLKEYDSQDKAKKEYDKLIAEKVKKGYVLVGEGASVVEPKPAKSEPKAAKAEPKSAQGAKSESKAVQAPSQSKARKDEDDADEKSRPQSAEPSSSGTRCFEFVEGGSGKFWEIALDGTSFTTRYGKIGTDGQQSLKQYDSESKAQSEYQKLVAEKVKKGYVEK
jgi:predicted DNA-binding WGR domain protein